MHQAKFRLKLYGIVAVAQGLELTGKEHSNKILSKIQRCVLPTKGTIP